MKKIIKFDYANIMFITKVLILALNFLLIYFMYNFYKEQVIAAIVVDDAYLATQSKQIKDDINLDKFNETVDKLNNRKKNNNPDIKNFFEVNNTNN